MKSKKPFSPKVKSMKSKKTFSPKVKSMKSKTPKKRKFFKSKKKDVQVEYLQVEYPKHIFLKQIKTKYMTPVFVNILNIFLWRKCTFWDDNICKIMPTKDVIGQNEIDCGENRSEIDIKLKKFSRQLDSYKKGINLFFNDERNYKKLNREIKQIISKRNTQEEVWNTIYKKLDETLELFIKKSVGEMNCEEYVEFSKRRTEFLETNFAATCRLNPSECASFQKSGNVLKESECVKKNKEYNLKNLFLTRKTYENAARKRKFKDEETKRQAIHLIQNKDDYEVKNFGNQQFPNALYPNIRKEPIFI
jgi:hypothetical protein